MEPKQENMDLVFRCPQCGKPVSVGEDTDEYLVSCPCCGAELDLTELEPQASDTADPMGSKSMSRWRKSTIPDAAARVDDCAASIRETYRSNGYAAQILRFEENGATGTLVQIKNSTSAEGSLLRTVTGMSSCATLKLTVSGDDLDVEVMAGKWLDKVGVAVVSWFVLWPILVTAAIGAFRQKSFLDRVYADTLAWFASNKS